MRHRQAVAGLAAIVSAVAAVSLAAAAPARGTAPFLVPADSIVEAGIGVLEEADATAGVAGASNALAHAVKCTLVRLPAHWTPGSGGAAPAEQDQQQPLAPTVRRAIAQTLQSLTGNCTTTPPGSSGGFQYRVCLGQTVRQFGEGGDFNLGVFSGPDYGNMAASHAQWSPAGPPLNEQSFTGGDSCGTVQRRTTVSLHCGPGMSIISHVEPTVCAYEVTLTHPAVCDFPATIFPRSEAAHSAERSRAVLEAIGGRLRGVAARLAGEPADGAPAGGVPGAEANGHAPGGNNGGGGSELTTRDVEGVGGRSIGVDDRFRASKLWAGLQQGAGGGAGYQATWALEAHHSLAKAASGGAGSVDHDATITCSVYSTDDLRKGGGTVDRGGATASSGAAPGQLGPFALVLTTQTPAAAHGGAALASGASLVRAVARGPNRVDLPLAVHATGNSGEDVEDDASTAVQALSAAALESACGGARSGQLASACAAVQQHVASAAAAVPTGNALHVLGALVFVEQPDTAAGASGAAADKIAADAAAAAAASHLRNLEYASLTVRLAPQVL